MAEVLIYRIEFIANSNGYVTGDIVDIFVETDDVVIGNSTSGIVVKKNDVVVGSGGTIGIFSGDPPFVQSNYNPQVCITGHLLQFGRGIFFPYGYFTSLADHPSCEIAPPNCDLIVVGSPVLTKPSAALVADGAIEINATSSNPIKYKLGSDFDYTDGTGQTSNIFTGLIAGTYRIYIRDTANCGTNVFINLPVNSDYGVRYRLEYGDIIGGETRIDVLQRGYVGAITEVIGGGANFQLSLRLEGEGDKFSAIGASSAVLSFISATDQQFLLLYTNDRELYRVKYYKNLDLKWFGKVLPQTYQENYKAPPYEIFIPVSDGLPQLKDYSLVQDDGQILFGTISLIKLVAYCLSRLNMALPIRVACNLYATDMDQTTDDDPFDQAYIDFECFYLSGETPTLLYVLNSILDPFGARIVQWEGRWNITRIEEMKAAYDYRDFDADGEYLTNGTYDPVVELEFPTNAAMKQMWAEANQNLEMRPGYGLLKVVYKMGLKPNIIKNGDFRLIAVYDEPTNTYNFSINKDGFLLVNGGYAIAELYEILSSDELGTNVAYLLQGGGTDEPLTGSAYIKSDDYIVRMGTNNTLKITIRYKLPTVAVVAGSTVFYADIPYIKVRMVVRYGSTGYLKNDGTWSITPEEVVFYANEYGSYLESEIIAQKPPFAGASTTGLDFNISVYHAYAFHADFIALATFKALDTFPNLGEGTRRTFRTDDYYTSEVYPDKLLYYELEENTSAESAPDIIRPDDYLNSPGNPNHNPKQWILKNKISVTPYANHDVQFWIDKIRVQFLTDGKDPIDSILRSKTAEENNPETFEKTLIIGSYSNLIVSETYLDTRFSFAVPGAEPIKVTTVTNALSADLIYTGYLRDVNGVGYETWARDGITESDKLHGILLTMYAVQYRAPWRLMRGSNISADSYMGLTNVIKEVNADDRIYLPMGVTLNDKMNIWNGEYHELIDSDAGSDGGGGSPYSSAFSTGFGSSGFN